MFSFPSRLFHHQARKMNKRIVNYGREKPAKQEQWTKKKKEFKNWKCRIVAVKIMVHG